MLTTLALVALLAQTPAPEPLGKLTHAVIAALAGSTPIADAVRAVDGGLMAVAPRTQTADHDTAFHVANTIAVSADAIDAVVTAYYVGAGKGEEGNGFLNSINRGGVREFVAKKIGIEAGLSTIRFLMHRVDRPVLGVPAKAWRVTAWILTVADIAAKCYAISTWGGTR